MIDPRQMVNFGFGSGLKIKNKAPNLVLDPDPYLNSKKIEKNMKN